MTVCSTSVMPRRKRMRPHLHPQKCALERVASRARGRLPEHIRLRERLVKQEGSRMYVQVRVDRYIMRGTQFRLIETPHGEAISFTPTAGRYAMMTEADAAPGVPVSGPTKQSSGIVRWRTRRIVAMGGIAVTVLLAACSGALPMPSRDASQGETMLDLADALNQIRDQSASLQDQLDSLRDVVYQQDTVIRKLALAAGVPVPPVR